jgi:cell division protease FtsH
MVLTPVWAKPSRGFTPRPRGRNRPRAALRHNGLMAEDRPAPRSDRSDGAQKSVPPAPMPRDKQGWRVAPAPDGRGLPDQHKPTPPHRLRGFWIFVIVLLAINWLSVLLFQPGAQPRVRVPFSPYFLKQVQDHKVKSITTTGNTVNGTFTAKVTYPQNDRNATPTTLFVTEVPVFWNRDALTTLLQDNNVQVNAKSTGRHTSLLAEILLGFGPTLLLVGLFVLLARRAQAAGGGGGLGGLGNFGRSQARRVDPEKIRITFDDVAGIDEAKAELAEIVDFLKTPERYQKLGGRMPHGVLLFGPPGTGKTLLARAVAGEARAAFFSIAASEFIEAIVGVGAARVRDLFVDARRLAPSIVFVDEIDAIGQRRGGALVSNDERDQTLNQMLAEMDGFNPTTGVVVIAATNRPEVLDPALLRPGRFDRQVVIPLPAQQERKAILTVHSRGKSLGPDVDLQVVARGTPGFSGADLANLVNEAAIFAVRAGRQVIEAEDFAEARDRVLLGRRDSSNALLPEEKNAVAVHESGHALVAVLSEHGDPVAKVTILPAGQALGVTEQLPIDERHLYSEGYLKDSLAIRMGGRAAEQIVFGQTSTGAANDLAGATDLATRMVREFGMSAALGPIGFASGSPMYLGSEEVRNRPYAEATQRVIDEEVTTLLREAEQRATVTLTNHRHALDRLTDLLLERETIDGTAVVDILALSASTA